MKEKMLLKKTCSIYANDLHFATVIFPFIHRELEQGAMIRTILEVDEQENIEKILKNVGLNESEKEKIRRIDWKNTSIKKIREYFKLLEEDIQNKRKINIVVLGKNIFIEKINKAIDLWVGNHIEILEKTQVELNIINCFSYEENKRIDTIINSHEYILKTAGLEEIMKQEELLKAN